MAGPNNSQRLNTVSISGLYDNETNVKKTNTQTINETK
ncbi:hypothetical protein TZ05_1743 [Listeria monocytogenes]|nr:hypothetical protein X845_2530 [Listeria monocytogenes Lm_1824]KKO42062.1 hypothetical protein TZ05_1743 [Listeria monocytogenes]KSZ47353.1 hypothetical protein AOA13_1575 [Listeria monocytogenes]